MRLLLGFALLIPSVVLADSIRSIERYLDRNTTLALLGNTDKKLAHNLLEAQKIADLDQPDSLKLSEDSVLRAIWIEKQYGGVTECDKSNCSLVWAQSMIAIDDRAHVTLTPPVLNFGDKNVIPTPEPATELLVSCSLALFWLAHKAWLRRVAPRTKAS